jgi:gamma-glutamyltranspeptidase / glutathione hydrolase
MNGGGPEGSGDFGVVSATDRYAALAGMTMLERGGNAFDAVVAAAFVMQVVEPHLSGPAGEVAAVFFARSDGYPRVLCGQGPAPSGATPDHFACLGLAIVPGTGVLSAPVPGAFDAWMLLLRDYGTQSLREVLDQAIGYAENGHPLLFATALQIGAMEQVFRDDWPTSAAVYLPDRALPDVGQMFRNRDLAATYRRILTEAEAAGADREQQIEAARRAWYQGFVAEEIERSATSAHCDPTFGSLTGVITAADLAGYEATYDTPATLDSRGWTVCKPGAWSQGPVFLQQLALLDGFDHGAPGAPSVEHIHVTVEAAKLAYADREAYYGDVPEVPVRGLLAPEYTADRRRLIGESASWRMRPGAPEGRRPRSPALVPTSVESALEVEEAIGRATNGRPAGPGGDTCHVAAADRWGNVVAATPSGGFLTNSPVISPLGFALSTRLEMTWLEKGLPNTLAPGRRPRTTLSPTLVLRGGEPVLAFGTPGADQQDQWALLFFLSVRAGLDLQAAMDSRMWHTNHLARSLYPHRTRLGQVEIEGSASEPVIAELKRRGHEVVVRKPASLSRLCAVSRDPSTGRLSAAADTRHGQAHACIW